MIDEAKRLAPRFAARAADHDLRGVFPADDFTDLRDAGLFGLMVPERLGGAGASFADYAAIAYELARAGGPRRRRITTCSTTGVASSFESSASKWAWPMSRATTTGTPRPGTSTTPS